MVTFCLRRKLFMKKLSILLAGISSILLLIGCNKTKTNTNTNTISENEFAEKLVNTEDPNYLSATIHATENITGTGDFDQNRNEERTEVYTHYPDTGAWIVEHGDSLLRKYIYNFDSLERFKEWIENESLTYSYKYYPDLSVEVKETGTYTDEMMGVHKTVTINSEMKIKINEYGYLTSLEGTYEQDIVQVSGENTYRGTKSGKTMVEISYK